MILTLEGCNGYWALKGEKLGNSGSRDRSVRVLPLGFRGGLLLDSGEGREFGSISLLAEVEPSLLGDGVQGISFRYRFLFGHHP